MVFSPHSLLPPPLRFAQDLPRLTWSLRGDEREANYSDFLSGTTLHCIYMNRIQYFSSPKLLFIYVLIWGVRDPFTFPVSPECCREVILSDRGHVCEK